ATFGGLSADGSALFYLSGGTADGGNIHRLDVASKEDVEINASADASIVNVSADGSRVYFISPSQLDGTKGAAGQPNLYVWSGAAPEFIATVSPDDLEGVPALTNWTSWVVNSPGTAGEQGPGADSSRT